MPTLLTMGLRHAVSMSLCSAWQSRTAFVVVGRRLRAALYSTMYGSRRCQFQSSVAIHVLPRSPLAVEIVPRGLVMSSQIDIDSCRRRRRLRRIQSTVPSLAVVSAIIRTLSSFRHR